MNIRLDGKIALVTGGAKNLGRAIALEMAKAGADVIVTTKSNKKDLDETLLQIQKLGRKAHGFLVDASQSDEVNKQLDICYNLFGKIDILVNNAALRLHSTFLDITPEEWEMVVGANLMGPINFCKGVIPKMLRNNFGRIVNVSGMDAFHSYVPPRAHNIVSKSGLLGLTKALAREFATKGINVNNVVPCVLDTERDLKQYPWWPLPQEKINQMIPKGRLGRPEEIAQMVVYLCSEYADFITGQSLHGNGGAYMP